MRSRAKYSTSQALPRLDMDGGELMDEPIRRNGVQANVKNRTFEVALLLALNLEKVITKRELTDDLGMNEEIVSMVVKQLRRGQLAERINPEEKIAKYRATNALRRMVRMHAPKGGGVSA